MDKGVEELISTANSLKNNSTYLNNDVIFKKVNVALNNLKSSLDINSLKPTVYVNWS